MGHYQDSLNSDGIMERLERDLKKRLGLEETTKAPPDLWSTVEIHPTIKALCSREGKKGAYVCYGQEYSGYNEERRRYEWPPAEVRGSKHNRVLVDEAHRMWHEDDVDNWRQLPMSNISSEDYLIAVSYSIPKSWRKEWQEACAYWFQVHSSGCTYRHSGLCSGKTWWYRPLTGGMTVELTWQKIRDQLLSEGRTILTRLDAEDLAKKMMESLDSGTVLEFVEALEPQEETKPMRTLYEVYAVNINNVDEIEVTQVVADSQDKAKMKALGEIDMEGKDLDDFDFFTKEIGQVRRP